MHLPISTEVPNNLKYRTALETAAAAGAEGHRWLHRDTMRSLPANGFQLKLLRSYEKSVDILCTVAELDRKSKGGPAGF
uniref:Uncharacterized protein n=1 Tax=Oryza punctata TaxID=4537 RepID=A0A0E0LL15_ORYPU